MVLIPMLGNIVKCFVKQLPIFIKNCREIALIWVRDHSGPRFTGAHTIPMKGAATGWKLSKALCRTWHRGERGQKERQTTRQWLLFVGRGLAWLRLAHFNSIPIHNRRWSTEKKPAFVENLLVDVRHIVPLRVNLTVKGEWNANKISFNGTKTTFCRQQQCATRNKIQFHKGSALKHRHSDVSVSFKLRIANRKVYLVLWETPLLYRWVWQHDEKQHRW